MENNMEGLNKLYVIGYKDGKDQGIKWAEEYSTKVDDIMNNAKDSIDRDSSLKNITNNFKTTISDEVGKVTESSPAEYVDGYMVGLNEGVFPHTELMEFEEKKKC